MKAYDGEKVCELNDKGKKYNSKNYGLYRDGGLAVFKNVSRPSLFYQKGFQIIIECNLKIVNYLDATFNLNDGSYQTYRKPNDEARYIHFQLDHPPSITTVHWKALITVIIIKRYFLETAPYYKRRLANCGFNEKLTYHQQCKKIKTLGKIENTILYGLTHSTTNCWTGISVNTFLDFSINISHRVTNFKKIFIKTL